METIEKILKILVVEDNNSDYELMVRTLEKYQLNAEYIRVQNEKEMKNALENISFDVIIADYLLPGFTGLDALKLFKRYKLNIPFITLTGTGAEGIDLEMMKEGSTDYVIKSHMDRLYHSIINQIQKSKTEKENSLRVNEIFESEKAYRLLAENSRDIISRHKLTGEFIYASPALYDITGYLPEEVIGIRLRDFLHPDDISKIPSQIDSILYTNNNIRVEYRFRKKDHTYIWIETGGKLVLDPDTRVPIEIVAVTRDATERVLKDIRIKESEEQYRIIAENATDMITKHDLNGFYNYISTSSYTLLGYAPEDLLGRSAFEFLHPDDIQSIQDGIEDFIKHGLGVHTASYRYKKKDGKYIWVESTNKLTFKESTGEVEGFISVNRDITERKDFENKLEEKIKELDTFIYRSSHDLKGPLASLQGLINIAKTEVREPVSIQYFSLIERSVNHLDTILMDLLNITRITQGNLQLTDINLNEVTNTTIRSFENLPEYEKIEWIIDLDSTLKLHLDKTLVNNIFQNLIINAIRYYDKSKENPFVKISGKKLKDYLEITIEDNGEGIPEEMQKNVFEMFFRGNTKSSGTGLGLYIVKNAVYKLGGEIEMSSRVSKGTKFTILFPLNLKSETNIKKLTFK